LFKGEGKKFTNFDEIRDHIVELTEKLCGANKNIVDDPIVVMLYSRFSQSTQQTALISQ
jgi:hypothetical protein